MGYVFSFILGVYVATVGITGVSNLLEKSLHATQQYMLNNSKVSPSPKRP